MNLDASDTEKLDSKFTKFHIIFFKYIFDKKPLIQEYASSVLAKLYQLGDNEIKQKLVQDLRKVLNGF